MDGETWNITVRPSTEQILLFALCSGETKL